MGLEWTGHIPHFALLCFLFCRIFESDASQIRFLPAVIFSISKFKFEVTGIPLPALFSFSFCLYIYINFFLHFLLELCL